MKICMLAFGIENEKPEAVNKFVYTLSRKLVDHGDEVFFINLSDNNSITSCSRFKVYNIKVLSKNKKYLSFFYFINFIKQFKNIFKKESPDILHDHFSLAGLSFIISNIININKTGVKLVKTVYN